MSEGYQCNGEGDCPPSWLDELLCEYVDGTMDPAVRASFEEVLRRDPDLARQVQQLRSTRSLLCHHGCQRQTLSGVQVRVRQRLACEMMRAQQPAWTGVVNRLGTAAMLASVMGVVMMVGMLAGMTLFMDEQPALADQRLKAEQRPREAVPSRQEQPAPLVHRAAMTPWPLHQRPMRRPLFVPQPTTTLPLPTRTGYLLQATPSLRPAHLQRIKGAP